MDIAFFEIAKQQLMDEAEQQDRPPHALMLVGAGMLSSSVAQVMLLPRKPCTLQRQTLVLSIEIQIVALCGTSALCPAPGCCTLPACRGHLQVVGVRVRVRVSYLDPASS